VFNKITSIITIDRWYFPTGRLYWLDLITKPQISDIEMYMSPRSYLVKSIKYII